MNKEKKEVQVEEIIAFEKPRRKNTYIKKANGRIGRGFYYALNPKK